MMMMMMMLLFGAVREECLTYEEKKLKKTENTISDRHFRRHIIKS